jgi:hypothetical protein
MKRKLLIAAVAVGVFLAGFLAGVVAKTVWGPIQIQVYQEPPNWRWK